MAFMRPHPPESKEGQLWVSYSEDRGLNWTEAKETEIPDPNVGFDLHRTDGGNLLLIDNPTRGQHPPEGQNEWALFMSEDDGDT